MPRSAAPPPLRRVLVTGDPTASMQPRFDTSLRLSAELLLRGAQVDYCDLTQADAGQETGRYLAALPAAPILAVRPEERPFIELGAPRAVAVADYQVVLQRKDPPVDDLYVRHARHFVAAPRHVLQINHPGPCIRYSEHLLPRRYPAYSIPTVLTETWEAFLSAVRCQPGEVVVKPERECSGIGIEFLAHDTPEQVLRDYFARHSPCVVQPYQPEITRSGDLRILVMNHLVLGAVLRVPAPGSRLANLHRGASSRAFQPTARQLAACAAVAEDLTPQGLYLLGLDFIGDLLSEVNITSPSALVQMNQVMGKRTEVELIDELERLHAQQAGG